MKSISLLFMLAASASAYTLHEWGTFTTVSGSDGVLLAGLEREEERLPLFSYSHYGLENGNRPRPDGSRHPVTYGSKGIDFRRPLAGVTVKMETPVIYFYSDKEFDVSVKVGFEGGTISQWYPDRSGGEKLPAANLAAISESPEQTIASVVARPSAAELQRRRLETLKLDFAKPYRGSIEWQAKVLSPEQSRDAILFKPAETKHWTRPRVPNANAVRTPSGETEGFLFYRGIGHFDTGLVTTVAADETLHLRNKTGGTIPYALVYERRDGVIRWKSLTHLTDEASIPVADLTVAARIADLPEFREMFAALEKSNDPPEEKAQVREAYEELPLPSDVFVEPVYRDLVAGLEKAGLFHEEARAMVETWWDSYFATEGLRVFWIVPEAKTAAVLPLEVSPAPEKTVRVMVGRSEVLRPSSEREMLARSQSANRNEVAAWKGFIASDRFGLAYGRRVEALTQTAKR